ncbi:MAG: sulfite exporter TauE/SafE family protein [Pseudomonadota bacterium]
MEQWLVLIVAMLAAGCAAGVLAGLFGIGGGIVIVPVLELILSFVGVDAAIRMHIAVATSLAVIVPTSLSSARAHHMQGAVDLGVVRQWWFFILAGSIFGAWLASQFHSRVLAAIFATLALLVGLKLMFVPERAGLTDGIPRNPLVKGIPTTIGALSAMMGIGGGTFSVMTLTLFNVPIHRAVGTASLLGLFIALPGAAAFVASGLSDPRLPAGSLGYVSMIGFACIAPTTVLCAPLGAKIAHAFAADKLKMLFGLFLAIAAVRMFWRAFA